MIHFIHQFIFYIHVAIGSIALIAFWLPIFTTKGSDKHKKSGQLFAWSMYAVAISGLIMTSMALALPLLTYDINPDLSPAQFGHVMNQIRDLNSFLFMLSLLVFCTTHHALMVVRHKNDRNALKTINYLVPILLLGISGLVIIVAGSQSSKILHMVFGGVSVFASTGMLLYIFRQRVSPTQWLVEHFSGLIGSGIGAYTAFFAFGGRRFLNDIFVGQLQLIPWITPTVIGLAFTFWLTRKYQTKSKAS